MVFVRGVFGKGGFCPGGFCPGVYVRGVFVRGVFVLEPDITMILLNSILYKRITFHSYNKFNTRLLNYKRNLLIFEL